MGKRDYLPPFGTTKGFWCQVLDKYGNSLDLTAGKKALAVDRSFSNDVGWMPFKNKKYTAKNLKKLILVDELGLNPRKYDVYASEGDNALDDGDTVDLNTYGLRKRDPITFKSNDDDDDDNDNDKSDEDDDDQSDSGNSDNDSGSSDSSDSDDQLPPPDNPEYIGNNSQGSSNADPYRSFTKKIQCMSNADWSRYDGSIQNTYQGEILWTDGNPNYGVANMMAYMVVRREPNTPTGNVIAVGRAANEPAYFVYLG